MKLSILLLFSIVCAVSAARADLCAQNEDDQQSVESAIHILQSNYGNNHGNSGPMKLYIISMSEMSPRANFWPTKGHFISVSDPKLYKQPPFNYLVTGQNGYSLDMGWTYYFDQETQKWTNLGRAVNCKGITEYLYIQNDIKAGELPLTIDPEL